MRGERKYIIIVLLSLLVQGFYFSPPSARRVHIQPLSLIEEAILEHQSKAIMADLDGTIAPSGQKAPSELIEQIKQLLKEGFYFAVNTGSGIKEVERQFLKLIPPNLRKNLYIYMESSGYAIAFDEQGKEKELYHYELRPDQVSRIKDVLDELLANFKLKIRDVNYERKSQITIHFQKGKNPAQLIAQAVEFLKKKLSEIAIIKTSANSINISQVDKSEGVRHFLNLLEIPAGQLLVLGDAFDPDGTDRPMAGAGAIVVSLTQLPDLPEGLFLYPEGYQGSEDILGLVLKLKQKGGEVR